MKKWTGYSLTFDLLVVAACFSVINGQECEFKFLNGTPTNAALSLTVMETTPVGTVLEALLTSEGTLSCQNDPSSNLFNYLDVRYNTQETNVVEFFLKNAFGDDFDNNVLEALSSGTCELTCPDVATKASIILIVIISPENTQAPVFSPLKSASITLEEFMPLGVDFSSLLTSDGSELTVYDNDFPIDTFTLLDFSVDHPNFKTLSPIEVKFCDAKGNERIRYVPRIAVVKPLSAATSPLGFNLIASDRGVPSRSTPFPITVTVINNDLRDPVFDKYYYTSTILSEDFVGELDILQGVIHAYDPDNLDQLSYSIIERDGLDVNLELVQDGIKIVLQTAVGSQSRSLAYIVIEAQQVNNQDRATTVVLVVELPTSDALSTGNPLSTTRSTECPTFDPSTICPSTDNPTDTTTQCPTFDPSTDCPSTDNPTSTTTECPTFNPITDCPSCSPDPSTTICPFSSTSTESSSTTIDCTSCWDGSTLPTVLSSTVNTDCPLVCPTTDGPDTTEVITCPAVTPTTSPSGPVVRFDLQQYAAEVIDNHPIGTPVVQIHATSSDGQMPIYTLKAGSYFNVDENGAVKLAKPLAVGYYSDEAVATISSGEFDVTHILVTVTNGLYADCEVQFSSAVYDATIDEGQSGVIHQVILLNGFGHTLSIVWSDPEDMKDYFMVSNDGNVSVVEPFRRIQSGPRVLLKIEAKLLDNKLNPSPSTVVDVIINDVNEPPTFQNSQSPVVVGYPGRTFFDLSVPMPVFIAQAFDPDEGDNAALTYHLTEGSQTFDIDSLSGSVFVKGLEKLTPDDTNIVVTVKDHSGKEASLNVLVKPLGDDFIHQLTADGPETLTDQVINDDLSKALGYKVIVLRKEKLSQPSRAALSRFAIILYAVHNDSTFVNQEQFIKKLAENANALDGLSWTVDTKSVSGPPSYAPQDLVLENEKLGQSKIDFTIATGVLAGFLGVILLLIAIYVYYTRIHKKKRKQSALIEKRHSLEKGKESADWRRFSNPAISSTATVDESNRGDQQTSTDVVPLQLSVSPVESSAGGSTSTGTAGFNESSSTSDREIPLVKTREEEVYCPSSPTPQKSILKDSSDKKQKLDEDKSEKESSVGAGGGSGVKFNEIPEVIQVAATSPDAVVNDDLDGVSDKDILMVAM